MMKATTVMIIVFTNPFWLNIKFYLNYAFNYEIDTLFIISSIGRISDFVSPRFLISAELFSVFSLTIMR